MSQHPSGFSFGFHKLWCLAGGINVKFFKSNVLENIWLGDDIEPRDSIGIAESCFSLEYNLADRILNILV